MSAQRTALFKHGPGQQRGAALLIMLIIMVVGITTVLVKALTSSTVKTARQETTAAALAQAKEALIGDTVSQTTLNSAGLLRLPDLGFGSGSAPSEGSSPPSFSGNNAGLSLIGKVPWKTLQISPVRDGQGECPWYVVSGRFKNDPSTSNALNWDTLGQIDVIDGNGNAVASNLAALLVAVGTPIDGQDRSLSDPKYTQCGGSYAAINYLDSYNSSDAVSGEVNYFTGSTNNRIAPNTVNKRFVMTSSGHYNDQFLFVSTDEIFRPIIKRSDFSAQITALMNDPYFLSATPTSANKGTGNVNCNGLNAANQTFCNNWKEMLLLANLPTPSSITIDGAPTAACSGVLIFGGQKAAAQVRLNAADKSNSANYLEAPNLAAFASPVAVSGNFIGASTFSATNPSADLIRCLP